LVAFHYVTMRVIRNHFVAVCLEGSRFVGWQFYPMAAGGSRELSGVRHAGRMRSEEAPIWKAAHRTA
jgi:hypothetical protein